MQYATFRDRTKGENTHCAKKKKKPPATAPPAKGETLSSTKCERRPTMFIRIQAGGGNKKGLRVRATEPASLAEELNMRI